MENWTQLATPFGVTIAVILVLMYVLKSSKETQRETVKNSRELTDKFIAVAEKTTEVQAKSTQAVDKLTEMIYQVLKINK